MNEIQRFWEYASTFEKVYVMDDWSLLEPFFTEDAVYEIQGAPEIAKCFEGADAVIAGLRDSVNGLDRRFSSRSVTISHGPEMRDGQVWIRWVAGYEGEGVPDLKLEGEETAAFRDGRICQLVDLYSPETAAHFQAWWDQYSGQLPPTK